MRFLSQLSKMDLDRSSRAPFNYYWKGSSNQAGRSQMHYALKL